MTTVYPNCDNFSVILYALTSHAITLVSFDCSSTNFELLLLLLKLSDSNSSLCFQV